MLRSLRVQSAAKEGREGSCELVKDALQAQQLVFNSEFFFLKGGNPDLVPIWVRHFGFDQFFQFLMFFGELLDMPLHCHVLHLVSEMRHN